MKWSDTCDYCGEYVKSPYTFRHGGVWYSGHKRCMGTPMIRKLASESQPAVSPSVNIAICGRLRSGKNAVADYLTQHYGYTQFAFGDELRRYAHELFDVGTSAKPGKPRELYQWLGQTMRQRDPDVWVRKCFDKIAKEREFRFGYRPTRNLPAVITDLRQPNEFDRCKSEGYVIIRVSASEHIRLERARAAGDDFDAATLNHETEEYTEYFDVDYNVINDGTLAELYTQVDDVVARIGGAKEAGV